MIRRTNDKRCQIARLGFWGKWIAYDRSFWIASCWILFGWLDKMVLDKIGTKW